MSKKEHVYYFDYLRVIAAISVIYLHAAGGPLRGAINTSWQLVNLFTSFASTAVPLFIMMSGYLLLSNERTLDIDILFKKRLPRLIVPLIGWTVVALLWKAFMAKSFSGFCEGLFAAKMTPAWTHLWYMYTLIALYLFSPFLYGGLKSLSKKGHILILILTLIPTFKTVLNIIFPPFVDSLLEIDIISRTTFWGGYLNIFILGYYLGNIKKKIPNWILFTTAAVLFGVIAYGTFYLTNKNGAYSATFQDASMGFEVLLASCVFLLFKQNMNRESKFLKNVPIVPLTFSIYLMHHILLSMMTYVFPMDTFVDTVFVTIVNFVICFFIMKTVANIKPICFIATGMSYKSACESCNWVYTKRKRKQFANRSRQDDTSVTP